MWKRSRLDPFVDAIERRSGFNSGVEGEPSRQREQKLPSDPIARRDFARQLDAEMTELLGIVGPPVAVEDYSVPVPGYPDARARVFWPTDERPASGGPADLPVQVYFFGGGFTMGGIDWVGLDAMFRARAAEAGIMVIAGEYSLAPEVQYPAQPEQCWSIFEWAVEHAKALGGDPARLAIGGASAGGNLAAAVTLMNRDRNQHPIRLQILEVPTVDLRGKYLDPRAISRIMPAFLLRLLMWRPLARDYLGDRGLAEISRQPYASPLLARNHAGLPPALILTAEIDPLRGDGEAYARALAASGVPATCVRYVGQSHGSGAYRNLNPAADFANRQVIATLRTLHQAESAYNSGPAQVARAAQVTR